MLATVYLQVDGAIASEIADAGYLRAAAWTQWTSQWLDALPDAPRDPSELSLYLSDDATIRALNARFRGSDRPTDVLAFATCDESDLPPAAEIAASEPRYLGDVIISVPTAARQAAERGHATEIELLWLASHGLLHLLGWDHPDAASLYQMLACQETLLRKTHLLFCEEMIDRWKRELSDYT